MSLEDAEVVVGVGVDVVDVARFERLVAARGERFARKWFTPLERSQCAARRRPGEAYAALFAVKEAVWKTLGVAGWHRPLAWRSIEVVRAPGGRDVTVVLHAAAAEEAIRRGVTRVHATVSVARGVAEAVATATRAAATA